MAFGATIRSSLAQVLLGLLVLPAQEASAGNMPADLQRAVLEAAAGATSGFRAEGAAYRLDGHGLSARLSSEGFAVTLPGQDSRPWNLRPTGIGRGGEITPMAGTEVREESKRVVRAHRGVIEWYRDTVLGIEQGFTIDQRPPGEGPLVLRLATDASLSGRLSEDGRSLSFPAGGGRTLHYDNLAALDASGAQLAARFALERGQIAIEVDDTGAAYPVTIDPLIYIETKLVDWSGSVADKWFGSSVAISGQLAVIGAPWADVGGSNGQGAVYIFDHNSGYWDFPKQIIASDGSVGDQFGRSVAISGTTVIIGAPGAAGDGKSGQGAAYVFVKSGDGWTQQQKLAAADGKAADYFGEAVALDGDTALIGAAYHGVGSNAEQGAAYVFVRAAEVWSQQQMLAASDGAAANLFGSSVALSGETALVGAPLRDEPGKLEQGAAYVFRRAAGAWSQQAKLAASDSMAWARFGSAVALSGETALVGAPLHVVAGNAGQGAAYVFLRSGIGWAEQAKLTASNGAAGDQFGTAVAVSGDTALVGAPERDDPYNGAGAAYIFLRSAGTWGDGSELFYSGLGRGQSYGRAVAVGGDRALVGSPFSLGGYENRGFATAFERNAGVWHYDGWVEGADGGNLGNPNYSSSVAIHGTTALLGFPSKAVDGDVDAGDVSVFANSSGTWTLQGRIPRPLGDDAYPWDEHLFFGISTAVSGDTALVGSLDHAYVYVRSGGTWQLQAALRAPDLRRYDNFGCSVALSGNTAIVGSLQHEAKAKYQGAAYVFVRSGGVWSLQAELTASDGATYDFFGGSVALDGDTALVGAAWAGDDERGAAYVFVRHGTSWSEQQKITASDGDARHMFGTSVALSGETALVGAPYTGDNYHGTAYVFVRSGETWRQDQKLIASDVGMLFGASLALDGDTAVIANDLINRPNTVYLFTRSGGVWNEAKKFTASDGAAGDLFGASVALSGNTAMVGAPYDDFHGSAYIFSPHWDGADVSVAAQAGDATLLPGQTVALTARVANHGPGAAGEVQVIVPLPSGLTHVSHTASTGSYDPSRGTWNIGSLAPGAAATLTIRASVPDAAAGTRPAFAVDLSGTDLNNANNGASVTLAVGHRSLAVPSLGACDGWVLETGETTSRGGAINARGGTLRLGDDAADRQYRSILCFDTGALPDNAVVTSATLKLRYGGVRGTNPFRTHRGLLVDIRAGGFSGKAALQASDFQAKASARSVGRVAGTVLAGWHRGTLAPGALPFVNRKGQTQLRLRFARDDNDDRGADVVLFNSGNALRDRPVLVVRYVVP